MLTGTTSSTPNQWMHVAMSVDKSTQKVKFYENGALINEISNADIHMNDDISGTVSNRGQVILTLENGSERVYNVTIDTVTDMHPDKTPWVLVTNYIHKGDTNPPLSTRTVNSGFPILPVDGSLDFVNVNINGRVTDGSTEASTWGHPSTDLFNRLCAAMGSPDGEYNTNGLEMRFAGKSSDHSRVMHFKSHWEDMFKHFRKNDKLESKTDWPSSTYTLYGAARNGVSSEQLHSTYLPGTANRIFDEAFDNNSMTEFPFYHAGPNAGLWSIQARGRRWEVDNFPNDASNSTYHQIWVRGNRTNSRLNWVNTRAFSMQNMLVGSSLMTPDTFKGMLNDVAVFEGALTDDQVSSVYQASHSTSSPVLSLNEWTHVAVNHNAHTKRLDVYLDGMKAGTYHDYNASVRNNTNPLTVGKNFVGEVAEPVVMERPLLDKEIGILTADNMDSVFPVLDVSFPVSSPMQVATVMNAADGVSDLNMNGGNAAFGVGHVVNAKALIFDGAKQASLNIGRNYVFNEMRIHAKVSLIQSATGGEQSLLKMDGGFNWYVDGTGKLAFQIAGGSTLVSSTVLPSQTYATVSVFVNRFNSLIELTVDGEVTRHEGVSFDVPSQQVLVMGAGLNGMISEMQLGLGTYHVRAVDYVTPKVLASFSFDESDGTDVVDTSGMNNNGTIVGGAVRKYGTYDAQSKGLVLNAAANQYVTVDGAVYQHYDMNTLTLSAWIRTHTDGAATDRKGVLLKEGVFEWYLDGTGVAKFYDLHSYETVSSGSTPMVDDDAWTHVAVVVDEYANAVTFFKNGVEVASVTPSIAIRLSKTASDLVIGRGYTGELDNLILRAGKLDVANTPNLYSVPDNNYNPPKITANEWNHVAGVFNKQTNMVSMYLNGEYIGCYMNYLKRFSDVGSNANDITVGALGDGSTFFDGIMDDVRIYKSSMNEDQIKELYALYNLPIRLFDADNLFESVEFKDGEVTVQNVNLRLPGTLISGQTITYYMFAMSTARLIGNSDMLNFVKSIDSIPSTFYHTTTMTTNGNVRTSVWNPDTLPDVIDATNFNQAADPTYALRAFVYLIARDAENNIDYFNVEVPRTFPEVQLAFTAVVKEDDTIVVTRGKPQSVNRYFIFAFRGMPDRDVVLNFAKTKVVPFVPNTAGGAVHSVDGHDVFAYKVSNVIPTSVDYLLPAGIVLTNAFASAVDTTTAPVVVTQTELLTTYMVGIDVNGNYHVVSADPYYFQPTNGPSASAKQSNGTTGTSINTKKVYLNVRLFDDRTYTIQRILPPYDSMDCWVTERRQADAGVASWTFTFSEASRLIQISHGGDMTDGFTELAVGYENMHFQPNHWSTPQTRESYKDFNAGDTVTIEAGGDTFFVTVGNRTDSTMPIVTRLTDSDFVHTGVLATGGVQDRPLEVVYKFDKPSNDGIEFYEVSMNTGTTVPVKRITMFATKTLEYSEENIVAFYDSYVQSITQSNARAIVHIASYDLDAGFADMSALDSTTLTHAYTDLFGTTEAVSEDHKYIVYFIVHDINDTITVKSKGYLKEYVVRDVDYSTIELVADSAGNLNHPVAVSVNDSSTRMGVQKISMDGMWMVTASSEYYYDGVYTTVRPGYFNIFKNMSSEVEAPSYEHYCHVVIPAEITITQGEGDDLVVIPEKSGTTIYRSAVSGSSITHDGTYVLVNGSNWAAVFKHDLVNKTYTLYSSLNRQMTQVVGYGTNANNVYRHKCNSGRISDNGEFVLLYGSTDTNANKEDITCGVWRNTGTDFELIQGDGFKWAFKHSNYVSYNMDISGDGKTIVITNGGRLGNDWRHGPYGYIDMGFRVYRLNPVTNLYESVQYARYNNWNNSVIETEENTSHDFLAQTGGGSTIGLRMPSSGWVQGIPNNVMVSYDGNNFLISGGRARDGQSGLVVLYVYNSNTKRFEFNSNFTTSDSQYGLGYTNHRTHGGNSQPTHYPKMAQVSAYGDYVMTNGNNYQNVWYIFKRKADGYYEKVYSYQSGAWTGASSSIFNQGQFGSYGGFIGAGQYIFTNSGSSRIVTPIQPHISLNERSTIPLKINDVLTTTMATTIDSYTDASARKTPWTLVLNYMHKAGTNPDLSVRDATGSMPVLPEDGSLDFRKVDINGTVENGSTYDAASWGHTGNDLFDKVCKALGSESDNANGLEVRFVGKSGKDGNDRLVHFKSDFDPLIKDYRYGDVAQGVYRSSENNKFTEFTLLEGHTAYLPDQDIVAMTEGTGDAAMTDGLFVSISSGNYAFYIGNGGRWESDDTNSGATNNTYHQIWVRANGAPYLKSVLAFNGTDAIDITGTVFSNAADITTVYPPVAFTMGVDLTDVVKTRDFFERHVTPLSGVSAAQYATTAFPAQSVSVAHDRLALPLASGATAEVSVKETNWGSITANTPTFELPPDQITGVTVSGKYGRKCAISADGKTALVTAPINLTSGEAYIWTYDGSAWNMVANLSKSTGVSGYYGAACALSGDGKTAIVAGYYDNTKGCAFVWQFDGTNWGVADGAGGFEPNYDLSSGARGQYGYSCALSGDGKTALIGASVDRKGGSAFLWRFTGDNWVMTGLSNPNANTVKDSEYGYSCALSGDGRTALVAGPNNNDTSIGNAFIWEFNPVTNEWGMFDWSNTFIAGEPHDLTGANLQRNGVSTGGRYGQACGLSLDGKTAVVSGWLTATAGCAWVWQYKDGEWGMFESDGSFTAKMPHNLSSSQMSGYTTAYYGHSCSISGDGRTVIIGDDTDSYDTGNLWLWEYDASTYAWGAFNAASAFTANAPHNLSMTSGAKGDYARSCSMSANGQYVMVSGANESANGQGGIWIWEATVSGERKPLTIGGEEYAVTEAVSSADYQVVMAVEDANGNFELGGQMISRTMYRQWPPPDASVTKGTLGSTSEWSLSNASYGNGSYKATVSPGVHSSHHTYGVFDNSQDGYFWHANANTYAGILTLHLPEPIALTGYSLMHRTHYDKEHSPKNWTIEGSNDNSTWTTVDTQTDQGTSYDNLKPRTYRFSNSTAYKYYRLNVTSTNGGNYLMVAEWRLYESFTGPSIYGPSASIAPMLTDFERQFGVGWQLIKSIDGGSSWFSRDKLQGYDGDEFLFSTGDFSRWLIADHSQVGATSNTSHTRTIKRSSISETPYQATWYDSSNNWNGIQNQETIVALESWGTSGANKTVMYVEGGVHTTSIHTSGMRVYTRTAPPS